MKNYKNPQVPQQQQSAPGIVTRFLVAGLSLIRAAGSGIVFGIFAGTAWATAKKVNEFLSSPKKEEKNQ